MEAMTTLCMRSEMPLCKNFFFHISLRTCVLLLKCFGLVVATAQYFGSF